MAYKKITGTDLQGIGVIGLADTPELSAEDMQAKFEETARKVIIPMFNTLVEELTKRGEPVQSGDIVQLRIGSEGDIQMSRDGSNWLNVADRALALKANSNEVYKKEEVYSKTESDSLLNKKADKNSVYEKTQVYTKTEADRKFNEKAAAEDVYTKSETIELVNERVQEIGGADMTKAVYDTDGDGVVDNAARLGGKSADEYMTKAGGKLTGDISFNENVAVVAVNDKYKLRFASGTDAVYMQLLNANGEHVGLPFAMYNDGTFFSDYLMLKSGGEFTGSVYLQPWQGAVTKVGDANNTEIRSYVDTNGHTVLAVFQNGSWARTLFEAGMDGIVYDGVLMPKSEGYSLIGGTNIPANSDLNSYTQPGNYSCYTNAGAATLVNCPMSSAFLLRVFSTGVTGTWQYRMQELMPILGSINYSYLRRGSSNDGGITWQWDEWQTPMPKSGGSFTDNVYAGTASRSGALVRNNKVTTNEGTANAYNVSTDHLIFQRK